MTIILQVCTMTPTPVPNPGVVPPWIEELRRARVDLHTPPTRLLPPTPNAWSRA